MAEYQLFSDKANTFECRLELEGASLAEATARIVVETADRALLFKGVITKEGVCSVTIPRLKEMLGETATGNMKLEVIAEDTYFPAWESAFVVVPSKRLQVEVATPKAVVKPAVKVTMTAPTPLSTEARITNEVVSSLRQLSIDANNVIANKTTVRGLLHESIERHGAKNVPMDKLLASIVKTLANR